jgi:hypothetical protein
MIKKLIMLAMAVAALAAIIPAAANAEGKLTSGGELVKPGAEITLTNDAANPLVTEVPGLGTNLVCEKITVHVLVEENGGSNFLGSSEGANTGTTENCELEGVTPVTITDPEAISLGSTTTGTGQATLSFVSDIPGLPACRFETVGPGVFHYTVGSNTATLTETELFSPVCGEAFIAGSLTVEQLSEPKPEEIVKTPIILE